MARYSQIGASPLKWHYLAAILACLALSVWSTWASSLPNPDASLYLRAADYFAEGRFDEGLAVYKWPAYSILIGLVRAVTGVEAFVAAQIVNALFALVTTVVFIALASEFSNRDRTVVTVAAIFIVFQPQLMELRSWIIRDHGYLALFLVAVYLAVADNERPSIWRKLALLAALAGATLFRVEGLYLALLVAGYYVLKRLRTVTAQVSTIAVLIFGATLVLPFAFSMWLNGTVGRWLSGEAATVDLTLFSEAINKRADILANEVLVYGGGRKWSAYASVVLGMTVMDTIRAITPVFAFFGVFAFIPNRLVPRKVVLPIAWFTLAQIPMLFLVGFINGLMDWRYPMALGLIAMFGIIYCATASWRELLMFRPRAFIVFPSLVLLSAITFVADLPQRSASHHLREAGEWIRDNVPEEARIWMNEARVAYFSGRPYLETGGVTRILGLPTTEFERDGTFDVLVVWSKGDRNRVPIPLDLSKLSPVATFEYDGESVSILAVCPRMVGCGE